MKASFSRRAIAYIFDIIIVGAIAEIVSKILNIRINGMDKQMNDITSELATNKISVKEYFNEFSEIIYEHDQLLMGFTILTLLISILYFVYFQYKNNGSTIGKRIMKIKIIKRSGIIDIKTLALRSALINSILITTLVIILGTLTNESSYYIPKALLMFTDFLFVAATALTMTFRFDKRGIHDLICNTEVINIEKEEEK